MKKASWTKDYVTKNAQNTNIYLIMKQEGRLQFLCISQRISTTIVKLFANKFYPSLSFQVKCSYWDGDFVVSSLLNYYCYFLNDKMDFLRKNC